MIAEVALGKFKLAAVCCGLSIFNVSINLKALFLLKLDA
jgi:hypothetical protein